MTNKFQLYVLYILYINIIYSVEIAIVYMYMGLFQVNNGLWTDKCSTAIGGVQNSSGLTVWGALRQTAFFGESAKIKSSG